MASLLNTTHALVVQCGSLGVHCQGCPRLVPVATSHAALVMHTE